MQRRSNNSMMRVAKLPGKHVHLYRSGQIDCRKKVGPSDCYNIGKPKISGGVREGTFWGVLYSVGSMKRPACRPPSRTLFFPPRIFTLPAATSHNAEATISSKGVLTWRYMKRSD